MVMFFSVLLYGITPYLSSSKANLNPTCQALIHWPLKPSLDSSIEANPHYVVYFTNLCYQYLLWPQDAVRTLYISLAGTLLYLSIPSLPSLPIYISSTTPPTPPALLAPPTVLQLLVTC